MAQKEGSCGYIDPPSEIPPSIVLGLAWLDIDGFQGESPSSGPKGHGFQVFQVAFGHRFSGLFDFGGLKVRLS